MANNIEENPSLIVNGGELKQRLHKIQSLGEFFKEGAIVEMLGIPFVIAEVGYNRIVLKPYYKLQ